MLSAQMTFVIAVDACVLPNAPQTLEQTTTRVLGRIPVRQ